MTLTSGPHTHTPNRPTRTGWPEPAHPNRAPRTHIPEPTLPDPPSRPRLLSDVTRLKAAILPAPWGSPHLPP